MSLFNDRKTKSIRIYLILSFCFTHFIQRLNKLNMLINNTKRFSIRPPLTWIIFQFNKRNTSTKLTSSYSHHVSSLPFIYKTLSQTFDETVNKYPNHECYVFKSISFISINI
jgi:hypothetical protein